MEAFLIPPFGEPADYWQQQQAQNEMTQKLYAIMDKLEEEDARLFAWAAGLKFQRRKDGKDW